MIETKTQVEKKFFWGVGLILFSLILGKVFLIPIILYPGDQTIWLIMIGIYVFSWIIMIIGMILAGIEGYRLATHKYKEYKRKTIHHVKNHSKNVVKHAAGHTKKVIDMSKKITRKK